MKTPASRDRNIMLKVAYDGTNYVGWQVQPNGRSVQECIESAIRKVTGEDIRVLCAGRTDSGVHALGQVASFRTRSTISAPQFRSAIQSGLPRERDIVIVESREVAAEFHATFSAVRKTYRYLLFDGDVCPPFARQFAAHSRVTLDAESMHQAAQYLCGTHDFRCFESHFPNKATSVRTIERATVSRAPMWTLWSASSGNASVDASEGDSPIIVLEFTADGFLYNMVRAIVGTLQEVGGGKHPPEHIRDVIASLDRSSAGMTAAAHGLYLVSVEYPEELLRAPADDSRS